MTSTKTYDYGVPSQYNYDDSLIEVENGNASLKLAPVLNQLFQQDFSNDTGFTYDNTKAEFTAGLVQQKLQATSDTRGWATYTSDANLNYVTSGSKTGVLGGTAAIVGNRLDLSGNVNKYVQYNNAALVPAQIFTIKFKWTPDYNGAPTNRQYLVSASKDTVSVSNSEFLLWHKEGNGNLEVFIRDSAGSTRLFYTYGAFSVTQGQTYEIEINVTLDEVTSANSQAELYIDGVCFGCSDNNFICTCEDRANVIFGADANGNGSSDSFIEDAIFFDTIQHSADYTAGYTLPETPYVESKVTLPTFSTTNLLAFKAFAATESNGPKYILNGLYYNGSGWTASSSNSESNTAAEVVANITTLPINDDLIIAIVFADSELQQNVDHIDVTYDRQEYSQTTPAISIGTCCKIWTEENFTFVVSETKTGNDEIKYVMSVDGTKMWYTGGAWVASNGTYAQANTATEVAANISTLITAGRSVFGFDALLYSDDGSSTPSLNYVTITYDAALPNPSRLPRLVDINGFIYNSKLPVEGVQVQIRPYKNGFNNFNDNIDGGIFHIYDWTDVGLPTLSDGFFSGSAYLQPDGEYWEFKIGKQRYRTKLIDKDANDLNELILELVND